jgi:hypothetical protein
MNEEIQAQFDRAKELAKEIWFDDNETEDASGRYYFNCGFAAGLKYQNLTTEEIEAIKYFASFQWTMLKPHTKTLNVLLERINNESRTTE